MAEPFIYEKLLKTENGGKEDDVFTYLSSNWYMTIGYESIRSMIKLTSETMMTELNNLFTCVLYRN